MPDSLLENIFIKNEANLIHKWHHHFELYERHFNKYKGKDITFVEIGVFHGGSLQLWKKYFGPNARIYGVDINPECKVLEEGNVRILIGSQENREFLRRIQSEIGAIDILLDDGGHTMQQQIVTFEELYHAIKPEGIYACEDVHTSYWRKYGGGLRRKGTFIEYSKNWIDHLHFLYPLRGLKANSFSKSTHSIHYYPGMVVLEKRQMQEPRDSMTGKPAIPQQPAKKRTWWKRLMGKP